MLQALFEVTCHKMKEMKSLLIALVLICCANINYQSLLFQMKQLDVEANGISLSKFLSINKRLIVPKNTEFDCACGCYDSPLPDCPPLYDLKDVEQSADAKVSRKIMEFMDSAQIRQKHSGEELCKKLEATNHHFELISLTGSYCLNALWRETKEKKEDRGVVIIPQSQRSVPVPRLHSKPSPDFLESLYIFIESHDIKSITDLGAGIGSYGAALEKKFPKQLIYRGYDGSSDVEDFTHGYIKFFDMSMPLNTPPSDWVLSINVGAHTPSSIEGMIIRNLHANNCKGIILAWETPEQPGIGHVNLHNNQYIIGIFEKLGYTFDTVDTRFIRESLPADSPLKKSFMVFPRLVDACE